MQEFILECKEDEYGFASTYIDMLLDYYQEYQASIVTWNDPGYTHLPEDEVRVVLQQARKKKTVEIIIVPSSSPGGADFGYGYMGIENNPLTHRSESTFLRFDHLLDHIDGIFENKICAILVKNYAGEILSSELAWVADVPLGKRKKLLHQVPLDSNGFMIGLCFVREIQICFWSGQDRVYHY